MTDMLVNYGSMSAAAEALTQASSAMSSDLEDMDAELRPTQSDWSGEAQAQYTAAKAQWNQSLQDMNALLAQLGAHVTSSSENYNATDVRGRANFGG
ncbi:MULTISPECIES: WXG100 family type VII secretion target [Actinomyces]|uniref:ESAT-6-like protein n=1 Tax=Actinomyces glycerinitolerans TaxID=1892869 RepID=A0A1M4RZE4_9ACTO|nr:MULTISPECIES: WXG100 family type VII secretion target [Actinomyces]MBE6474954.1 WXG100 family type VII secretion target [Actinomyces succiniciruminis]MBM6980333.1 WXG100 family type VII secretion target [Actinomyces succiniciruminis]RAX20178.1 WXG100 family type VII secretion target [Actinomyces sp. Z5]RAX24327.1 WXG100 family type VII secretion target [Actinomyces sp. Z3]SHE25328.1 proteins of 100 residues with wxg [Actinomyces glycerinitolerans]